MASPTATGISVLTTAEVQSLADHALSTQTVNPVWLPDGPNTIGSGASQTLSGGPGNTVKITTGTGPNKVTTTYTTTSVLLVLSATDLTNLGSGIDLTFGGLSPVHVDTADFFTGILDTGNNGAVNNIKFGSAEHAAVDIAFDGAIAKNDVLGDLSIVSPLNLRVDVWADTLVDGNDGLLGRAANSHAEGVLACTNGCGHPTDVPEPMSMALLGSGLIGLAASRRRRDTTRS